MKKNRMLYVCILLLITPMIISTFNRILNDYEAHRFVSQFNAMPLPSNSQIIEIKRSVEIDTYFDKFIKHDEYHDGYCVYVGTIVLLTDLPISDVDAFYQLTFSSQEFQLQQPKSVQNYLPADVQALFIPEWETQLVEANDGTNQQLIELRVESIPFADVWDRRCFGV